MTILAYILFYICAITLIGVSFLLTQNLLVPLAIAVVIALVFQAANYPS